MQPKDLKFILTQRCGLDLSLPVIAGFSGGADSLALIISLKDAGMRVTAAHFNHHLRPEADRDAQMAGEMAARLAIPFLCGGGDVPAMVREMKISVEEAARQARYTWLLDQAHQNGAQAVAVAHTADDQVETVLMHLLRGSGLDGLTGMPYRQIFSLWNANIPIVRPLLSFWRADTEAICQAVGIQPVMDESNLSTRYFRNRIRHELVPKLQEYNPQVKNHLLQTAQILSEEKEILEEVKEKAWQECRVRKNGNWLSFYAPMLESLPESTRRLVLRRGLLELEPALRDIDFSRTEMMSDFVIHSTRSGEAHLFGNFWAQKQGNEVYLWKGKPGLRVFHPQLDPDQRMWLPLPGSMDFSGWRLEASEVDIEAARAKIRENQSDDTVWLDADRLNFPLSIRAYNPGDRVMPLGMHGKTQKISDYFTNRKIPRQARKGWPLLSNGSDIIWVVGQGISEFAAITPQTRRVVQISLQYLSPRPDGSV